MVSGSVIVGGSKKKRLTAEAQRTQRKAKERREWRAENQD
jgi:hypothetical protein